MSAPSAAAGAVIAKQLTGARAAGKVLDVSGVSADGTQTRSQAPPKTAGAAKKGVAGSDGISLFPVISNNYTSFNFAMESLALAVPS